MLQAQPAVYFSRKGKGFDNKLLQGLWNMIVMINRVMISKRRHCCGFFFFP